MMRLLSCLTGIHPFSEGTTQAIFDYKYGRASLEPVGREFESDLTALIKLQQQLGFGLVSMGNLGWGDLFRPFTEHIEGIRLFKSVNDLPVARYPLTNTFYRQPAIEGQLVSSEPFLTESAKDPLLGEPLALHRFLPPELKDIGWFMILPGPYYFQYCATGDYSPEERIQDFAGVLITEIKSLENVGFSHILLDESPLTWQQRTHQIPHSSQLFATQEALGNITSKCTARIQVHTANGDILWRPPGFSDTILDLLLNANVDGIGIDFFQTKVSAINDYSLGQRDLIAGLVDATGYARTLTGEIVLEDPEAIAAQARQLEQLEPRTLILAPTTRLEMIPRTIADRKLKVLGESLRQLRTEEN
jgi:methionine synthase II (cobalamin-independent)